MRPGTRLSRQLALYPKKKRYRLPAPRDLLGHVEEVAGCESLWQLSYSSVSELSCKVLEVLDDQRKRGQVFRLSKPEARSRQPDFAAASHVGLFAGSTSTESTASPLAAGMRSECFTSACTFVPSFEGTCPARLQPDDATVAPPHYNRR